MDPVDVSLTALADRVRVGDADARQSLRQELETRLLPLVRCALRRGSGLPAVVSWVRGRFEDLGDDSWHEDPGQAAPRIARLLCARLVGGLSRPTAAETARAR